jgi:predicted RNase H-like HicB family nuclease
MNEITFDVERNDSDWLVASWDAPDGKGGIATQGRDLRELQDNVKEAVLCHFEDAEAPQTIRLHFIDDPVLATP